MKLLNFKKSYAHLEDKWWHRMFKIVFIFTTVLFVVFVFAVVFSDLPENNFNTSIDGNLREFTKNSSKNIDNTIISFIEQGKVGCLNNSKIEYLSSYDLKKDGICNADISGNIDKVSQIVLNSQSYKDLTREKVKDGLLKVLSEDKELRFCFIPNSVSCSSDNIVTYHKNIVFYAEVVLITLLFAILWYLLIMFVYYKGFIYIIYGKKKMDKQ